MCYSQVLAWIDIVSAGSLPNYCQCKLILVLFSSGMYFCCVCVGAVPMLFNFAQNVCLSLLSTVTGLSTIALH